MNTSEAGFTKGPWVFDEELSDFDYGQPQADGSRALLHRYVRHVDSGRICRAYSNCLVTSDEELNANARLIAAAPELFEELVNLRDQIKAFVVREGEADFYIGGASAAINKARGK